MNAMTRPSQDAAGAGPEAHLDLDQYEALTMQDYVMRRGQPGPCTKVLNRRNLMMGAWAADMMKLSQPAALAYAVEVADIGRGPGGELAVFDRLMTDFRERDVPITAEQAYLQLSDFARLAEVRAARHEEKPPLAA